MRIRAFETADWQSVWAILEPVFRAGETYAFPTDVSEDGARSRWLAGPNEVFVAEDPGSGRIIGTYFLRPNHEGPGGHVCNCGYVVSAGAEGRGIATAMCVHSQERARARGFHAMQFNLVAASNERAVRLWRRLGFEIAGTLPQAFRHPKLGLVDAHVMYKRLDAPAPPGDPPR